MTNYDIGIIGAGISGVFAALRLAEKYKHLKVVLFEFGPPPPNCLREDPVRTKRRRRQLEGWFGCFPTGDGKVYTDEDIKQVLQIADGRRTRSVKSWFESQLTEVMAQKFIKNKSPNNSVCKAIADCGFDFTLHNFEQWYPDQIHQLAKNLADKIEFAGNVYLSFDTEVYSFLKTNKSFLVYTSQGDFKCKKLIVGVGRSGWRWVNDTYKKLGILQPSKKVKYGIRVEMPASSLKDFQKAHCSMMRNDLEIGPLNWMGSIIQEDHDDMTIAAFRSNEDRWKSDKVFFSIKKVFDIESDPCQYLDRIAKLSHLLSGDRVGREKIKSFINGCGDLNQMPEYNWIGNTLPELESIFPGLIHKGYFHIPDIDTNINTIKINNNLETEIDGLFVTGECASVKGIAAAGITGAIAAEGAAK